MSRSQIQPRQQHKQQSPQIPGLFSRLLICLRKPQTIQSSPQAFQAMHKGFEQSRGRRSNRTRLERIVSRLEQMQLVRPNSLVSTPNRRETSDSASITCQKLIPPLEDLLCGTTCLKETPKVRQYEPRKAILIRRHPKRYEVIGIVISVLTSAPKLWPLVRTITAEEPVPHSPNSGRFWPLKVQKPLMSSQGVVLIAVSNVCSGLVPAYSISPASL